MPGAAHAHHARYRREIAAGRLASRRLRFLSALSVAGGAAATIALVALLVLGALALDAALGWAAVTVFTVILGGVGGYVASSSLDLAASRLEISLDATVPDEETPRASPAAAQGERLSSAG